MEAQCNYNKHMEARPYSPAWYWQELGYRVEKEYTRSGLLKKRNIFRPDGSQVWTNPEDDMYLAELEAAEKEYGFQKHPATRKLKHSKGNVWEAKLTPTEILWLVEKGAKFSPDQNSVVFCATIDKQNGIGNPLLFRCIPPKL